MIMTKIKPLYILFGLVGLSFLLLYYPVFFKLIQDWENDADYSHGYFIPFIAGYMVWVLKDELQRIEWTPNNWGLLLIFLGLAQLIVAWVGSEYFLQGTSMILVLLGIVLFMLGTQAAKKLLLPIAYLIFMIPLPAILWNQAAFPLALFASKVSSNLIQGIGISVLREGNILTLPNITLQVAEACSGLRSLVTLLALSAVLAFMSQHDRGKKWILFLSAVPVALACNIFRLTGTAVLARYFGAPVAHGFIHEFSGWVVFVLGLLLLLGVHFLLGIKARRLGG